MDKAVISSFYILRTKLFSGGWGDPNLYKDLSVKMKLLKSRDIFLTNHMTRPEITLVKSGKDEREFSFTSPFTNYVPGSLMGGNSGARFLVVESNVKLKSNCRPLVIHMARTGDQDYSIRKGMAKRLAKCGVSSIIMLHPFYGDRRPPDQKRHALKYVTDLFVMGGALILESLVLKQWCDQEGYGPIALHGVSLGGFMCSLSATAWPTPVSVIPCLSWTTAAPAFTQGVIADMGIDWRKLDDELRNDKTYFKEILPLCTPSIPSACLPYHKTPDFFSTPPSSNVKKTGTELPQDYPDDLDFAHSDMQPQLTHQKAPSKLTSFIAAGTKSKPVEKSSSQYPVARQFMYDVMNAFTHLGHYATPVDTRLVHLVYSKDDQYIPRVGVIDIQTLWPGSQVSIIDKRGHIFSYLMDTDVFELAILQSLSLQGNLYYGDAELLQEDIRKKRETFKEKLQQALSSKKQ